MVSLSEKKEPVMERPAFRRGKKGWFGLAGLALLAAALWWQRTPLLAWYYLRGLAAAEEADQDIWVERVANLDTAALPGLLDLLGRDDPRVCGNARASLAYLVQHWGTEDSRSAALADRLAERLPRFHSAGRLEALQVAAALVAPSGPSGPPRSVILSAGKVLRAAAVGCEPAVLDRALVLADGLIDYTPPAEVVQTIHALVRAGMLAGSPAGRARALHVARAKALGRPRELLELAVPLLRDPAASVRREAICLLACEKDLLGTEDLLAWLHDPDGEVRSWCAKALRARGEPEINIQLGRLITDERPRERLKVFGYLRQEGHPAPAVWVLRLCDDPEPAVRIAAARAAVELCPDGNGMNVRERLRDMAQNDRSPTVRQVAESYYHMAPPVR
jgi:hypothetical protein